MKYIFFSFIFYFLLLQPLNLNSQSFSKQQILEYEAEKNYTSNPKEALKILLLLKETNSYKKKININLLVSKTYRILGDYTNSANYLFQNTEEFSAISNFQKAKINVEKASFLRTIYLNKQADIYLNEAYENLKKIKQKGEVEEIKKEIFLQELEILINKQENKKAKNLIKKTIGSVKFTNDLNSEIKFLLLKSRLNSNQNDFKKSTEKFKSIETKILNKNLYFEFMIFNEMSKNYFYTQNYLLAKEYAEKAKKISNLIGNQYYNESANETLSLCYLALNRDQEYKNINTELLTIRSEIEKKEEETINKTYNLLNNEYLSNYQKRKLNFSNKLYLCLGLFVSTLSICGLIWYKKYSNYKRLKEIVNYFKVTDENLFKKDEICENAKKINIPLETENMLLNKLKKFESTTKFTNKEISLAVLAGQFDTNTKYLSEIINKHYNVNFNTYINKLRINFIIEKLKSDPNFSNYKISYLAEISGFSSHSSFATIFKSITGISPITFIDFLKNKPDVDKNISETKKD